MGNPIADKRRPTRNRITPIRFSEDEYERIRRAATRADVTPSVLVRVAVLDAVDATHSLSAVTAVTAPTPQGSSRELVDLRTAVNRVGGNLNQLARLSNQHGAVVVAPDEITETISQSLSELLDLLAEVRAQLGGQR